MRRQVFPTAPSPTTTHLIACIVVVGGGGGSGGSGVWIWSFGSRVFCFDDIGVG